MNGVNFDLSAYENREACHDFIDEISLYLFEEGVGKKLKKVNFISVLCDGSTDKSVTEQEVIYVIFVDPHAKLPVFHRRRTRNFYMVFFSSLSKLKTLFEELRSIYEIEGKGVKPVFATGM